MENLELTQDFRSLQSEKPVPNLLSVQSLRPLRSVQRLHHSFATPKWMNFLWEQMTLIESYCSVLKGTSVATFVCKQGRNEGATFVRGVLRVDRTQGILAPPCSNLRSFGSKSTLLKSTCYIIGAFLRLPQLSGAPRSDSAPQSDLAYGKLFTPSLRPCTSARRFLIKMHWACLFCSVMDRIVSNDQKILGQNIRS